MKSDKQKAVGTPFYRFIRHLGTLFSFLVYPCQFINAQAADIKAPFILLCNHQSMMDPILLAVKFKQHEIHFIGKRELTDFKPLKWVVEHLHMIAVSRHMSDLSAMRAAGSVLKAGEVLGIFPEGKRSRGVPMEQMESGVSLLALRHRMPLLPVFIAGRPRPFRKVKMIAAPPIQFDDLLADGIDMKASGLLNERIQQVYQELYNKYIIKTSVA
jgi:1-acyl-sn-glycerol-3-phosphate acyltransferase